MNAPAIKLRWEDEADRELPLPSYETEGAAGADIRANFPLPVRNDGLTLAPGGRGLVPTGMSMEIPDGFEVQIRPRSGLALKNGIALVNAPGTIDSDYRGPVGVIVINHGDAPFQVTHGMRSAQMVVAPGTQARFDITDTLGATSRGSGGFGSTGTSS